MIVDYFVSGVWKTKNNVVSLLVHKNTEEGFTNGLKMSVKDVILLIREGFNIHAIRWNYDSGLWNSFAPLEVIKLSEDFDSLQLKHLYTYQKLENLIDMSRLIDPPAHRPLVNKRITKEVELNSNK